MTDQTHIQTESEMRYTSIIIAAYLCTFMFVLIGLSLLAYLRQPQGIIGSAIGYLIGNPFEDSLIRSLVYIGSAGGLGGIIYCMRGFHDHKAHGDFNIDFSYWYFFRPIISTVTGVIIYFLFAGGLLTVGSDFSKADQSSTMFFCSVSFLAGFGFTQFYNKVDDLANTLFGTTQEPKKVKAVEGGNADEEE